MHLSKAQRIRRARVPESELRQDHRVPPGQVLTNRFPILHEGDVPTVDLEAWTLRVHGAVAQECHLRYADLLALPQQTVAADIHCVTRWSKLDTEWTGVLFSHLYDSLHVLPEAKFVMAHGANDYESITPLADLLRPNVLLAHTYAGDPLTPKHGWPLRLVVPHLYFWKSAKWLHGLEFLTDYRPGYWERNGFHDYGDPFTEQRFSDDDQMMPENEWMEKEYD